MKWKIKKEWIIKIGSWPDMFVVNYYRKWNNKFWFKKIGVQTGSKKENGQKMVIAAFNEENNKKPFKNLKLYHGHPSVLADNQDLRAVVLSNKVVCDGCGKEILPEESPYFHHPVETWRSSVELDAFCEKCNENEKLLKKLKE